MKKITIVIAACMIIIASCKKDSKTESAPSSTVLSTKFDLFTRDWKLIQFWSKDQTSPFSLMTTACLLDNTFRWTDTLTWFNLENGNVCAAPFDLPNGDGTWSFNSDSTVVLMNGLSDPSDLQILKLNSDSLIFTYSYSIFQTNYTTKYVMIPK